MTTQTEIINLSDLIPSDHIYRQFTKIIDIDKIANKHLSTIVGNSNYKGYGINTLFKALLLQHLEDLSDRELERFLQENNAGKWFCDFNLSTKTPTYSIFSKIRTKIGTRLLAKIFNEVKDNLKTKGYINEVFAFIDCLSWRKWLKMCPGKLGHYNINNFLDQKINQTLCPCHV